jgi:hypothetical protein
VAPTVAKGHGRLEKRTTILTKHQGWAGLQQGFAIVRERTQQGRTTVEKVHGISSLAPERADAARLLELNRGPWGIENGLPYRRNVTLGEDAGRVRKGGAPQVLAAVRNGIIQLRSTVEAPSLAARWRRRASPQPCAPWPIASPKP